MNNYLAERIIECARVDQEARFLEDVDPRVKKFLVYSIDAAHSQRFRGWIRDYGYPTLESVGEEALHWFGFLVHHQDFDLALMEDCLKNCTFSPEDTAYLVDRINLVKKIPQVYGTHFHMVDGVRTMYPIENRAEVNSRRSQMGLESLEEYVESQGDSIL